MKHYQPIPAFDEVTLTFDVAFRLDFAADPDGGYVLMSPELPGFEAWGRTPAAARHQARIKLIDYLEESIDAAEPVPLLRYKSPAHPRRHWAYKPPGFGP